MSDSSYISRTRYRRPLSTAGRPSALDVIDDAWASATLSDDDIDVDQQITVIAPILDEGDLDVDAIVVSNRHSTATERRRREEGRWNDLGLDYFESGNGGPLPSVGPNGQNHAANNGRRQ